MTVKYDAVLALVNGVYDIQIDSEGDILTEDFFDTALLMSLFAERRALDSEMPDPQLRRGWIGNESTPDFENGSKLWLHEQARVTRTTLNEIETIILSGLQWLVDDNLVVKIEVNAGISNGGIAVNILIERIGSPVEKRYFELWNNTGAAA